MSDSMRTSRTTVTFLHPFTLVGIDEVHPAGTYTVVVEEEQIYGLSFEGWRRIETSLRLPAIGQGSGFEQVLVVEPQALEDALARDAAFTG
jgi:hypothetical protein